MDAIMFFLAPIIGVIFISVVFSGYRLVKWRKRQKQMDKDFEEGKKKVLLSLANVRNQLTMRYPRG